MADPSADSTLRQFRTLYLLGPTGGLGDARLVARFLDGDGPEREEAFAALVRRHGPMVLGVCRRMLGGSADADADDAFQAVFLVLARKAGAVRGAESLRNWLYAVAVRTAKEARRRVSRRRAREGATMAKAKAKAKAAATPDRDGGDLQALLDEEIARLPDRFRAPFLLCEAEGLSRREAAARLGVPEGTFSSRLARARALLRDRLGRRGVAAVPGVARARPDSPTIVELPGPLVDATTRLALNFAWNGAGAGAVPARGRRA